MCAITLTAHFAFTLLLVMHGPLATLKEFLESGPSLMVNFRRFSSVLLALEVVEPP